jgi:sphingolipid delta-4 desaturase
MIASFHLPKVRKAAPEFYENLPYHTNCIAVIYNWIFHNEIGLYSRIDSDEANAKKDE